MEAASPAEPRWIDRLPDVPRQEMQVLCLGLSRTATMSVYTALKTLGYNTYHFKELAAFQSRKERHVLCWREALTAKLSGSNRQYGKAEFDKLLARYNAVTDAPCVNFSDELVKAYPRARVILTKRNPDKWLASILVTYHRLLESSVFRIAAVIDPHGIGPLSETLHLVLQDWTGGDWRSRERLLNHYFEHNDHIRKLVPKENLLEWEPKDGWEPLCKFLGKPVPNGPFPHVNKGNEVSNELLFVAGFRLTQWLFKKVFLPTLITVGLVALGARWFFESGLLRLHSLLEWFDMSSISNLLGLSGYTN